MNLLLHCLNTVMDQCSDRVYILAVSILLIASCVGCDTPVTKDDTSRLCVLNSDCLITESCSEGRCIPKGTGQLVAENCEGGVCECESDESCPEMSFCDLASRRCTLIECQLSSDCDLGLTCLRQRCVVNLEADQDRDGVPDQTDNCPGVINSDQVNTDQINEGLPGGPLLGDELGDACDEDLDNDGILNEMDNCLKVYNPDQRDSDNAGEGDGVVDRCEPTLLGVCGSCPVDRVEGEILYCGGECDNRE